MVGSETPKTLATSFLGMPRSTAANTFNLRSFEYGFMPQVSHPDQSPRKPLSGAEPPSGTATQNLKTSEPQSLIVLLRGPSGALRPWRSGVVRRTFQRGEQ